MNLTAWLEQEKGRSATLAAHFSKTPAAISQWKKNGVPVDLMKAVRDVTRNEVTLEEMVPGISSRDAPDAPAIPTAEPSTWPLPEAQAA